MAAYRRGCTEMWGRLRPSIYALYMAVVVVSGTAVLAPRQILHASLEPEWVFGFSVILLGSYAVARVRHVVGRLVGVTLAGTIAWVLAALWPFGLQSVTVREFFREMAEWWGFFL